MDFQYDETSESMEYYENPIYFIKKALFYWDSIIEEEKNKTNSIIKSNDIIIWEYEYKKYLESLIGVTNFILFNGLQNFNQIVTFCNTYHQTKLLREYKFKCECYIEEPYLEEDHYYLFYKNPFICSMNHPIKLINSDVSKYNYIGFISEQKPIGELYYIID